MSQWYLRRVLLEGEPPTGSEILAWYRFGGSLTLPFEIRLSEFSSWTASNVPGKMMYLARIKSGNR